MRCRTCPSPAKPGFPPTPRVPPEPDRCVRTSEVCMSSIGFTLNTLLLLGAMVLPAAVLAKRVAPRTVATVLHDGVEYSAPTTQMGTVVATDTASGKVLWSRQIYVVWFEPELEKDMQDCFVTSLSIDGKALMVTNEAGRQYRLDLETLELSGAPVLVRRSP